MSFKETAFTVYDYFQDPRTAVPVPIMSRLEQMQFAKIALQKTEHGRKAFEKVFGEPVLANPLGQPRIPYTPVPFFAWTK
jgi:hypothetical protein